MRQGTSKSKPQQWHTSPQYEWASSMSLTRWAMSNTWWRGPGEKESLQGAGAMKLETAPKQNSVQVPERKTKLPWTSSQCLKEYPGKIRIQKEICTQICSALPVTTAEIWKQTVRPHERIKRNGYTSTRNMIRSWNRMKWRTQSFKDRLYLFIFKSNIHCHCYNFFLLMERDTSLPSFFLPPI